MTALALVGSTGVVPGSARADDTGDGPRAAARRAADETFTIAVYPDTQTEVMSSGDTRLRNRSQWVVANRERLDVRFVTHVGDLTNWGWAEPSQLDIASSGMRPLDDAGIPYSISVGNHDTMAPGWDGEGGYGGNLYVYNPECRRELGDQCRTPLLLRRTEAINNRFDADRFGAVAGAYEPGKIDNIYSTFTADGLKWMVLNLELYPRAEVVDWANRVVRDHPERNVLINTHGYLNGRDKLHDDPRNGETSPRDLWERLVSRHPNIKIVVNGHNGDAGMRVSRGRAGNKVVALRSCFHAMRMNPLRLITVNVTDDLLRTRILSPATKERLPEYTARIRGMDWIR